ncbi:MAG TPA: tRNA glutamyl-Q(34) synthetase GluQRS, partial [Xanthomonadaceae bacterium]|nr:tRNA glutamyl-Q(34) synthetase GluQRS [Xanthomonadaceae bacterium]
MNPTRYRGRFAPSPTGPLHLGSLLAAAASWLVARFHGGDWLLRIEDIDPPREVPGAARQQIETLAAFGMTSDEPVLWQGMRSDAYAEVLERLRESGAVFPCACSRRQLEGRPHQGRCAAPDAGQAHAWRVQAGRGVVEFDDAVQGRQRFDMAELGDFVVRRVEGLYAYQLAVVVDDAFQGITQVVRGADLLDSTPRQIHLQRLLALPEPGYAHLPLLLDAEGRKLSKSMAAMPVDGADPMPALIAALGLLGLPAATVRASTPARALARALEVFDPDRLPRGAALTAP